MFFKPVKTTTVVPTWNSFPKRNAYPFS